MVCTGCGRNRLITTFSASVSGTSYGIGTAITYTGTAKLEAGRLVAEGDSELVNGEPGGVSSIKRYTYNAAATCARRSRSTRTTRRV